MKHFLTFALMGVLAVGLASEAFADQIGFDLTDKDGQPIFGHVLVDDGAVAGAIQITGTVSGTGGVTGDLLGVFWNFSDRDLTGFGTDDVTGADVTGVEFADDGVTFTPFPDPFDVRVDIGTNGIGTDDIQFTIIMVNNDTAPPLVATDFTRFGMRITSVGVDGQREDSAKLLSGAGQPVPEPGSLALLGIGALGLLWYRRRKSS